MASTFTTFQSLLKELYLDKDYVEELQYPDRPLLGMLQKLGSANMVGEYFPVPVILGNPQGLGGVFATSQTNASNNASTQFNVKAGDFYGTVHIGDKVFKASRNNKGAHLANKKLEIDGLYEEMAESMSTYLWGNGGQSIGQVGSIAGDVVSLQDPEQVANFALNMQVGASGDGDGSDSSHSLRGSPSYTEILGTNPGQGIIELDVSDISGLAAGDHLFRESDFFGDEGTIVLKGIRCYVADNDTPPELWGVTSASRALHPHTLGGCRVSATETNGRAMDERIQILCSQMTGRFRAKAPTAGFVHPETFQELSFLMQAKGERPLKDSETKFGYMKISVVTPAGVIPIYSDRHCPRGEFFALRLSDWELNSLDELFHPQGINESGGGHLLRRATTTDYEFRLLSYPGLVCRAPRNQGRVNLEA